MVCIRRCTYPGLFHRRQDPAGTRKQMKQFDSTFQKTYLSCTAHSLKRSFSLSPNYSTSLFITTNRLKQNSVKIQINPHLLFAQTRLTEKQLQMQPGSKSCHKPLEYGQMIGWRHLCSVPGSPPPNTHARTHTGTPVANHLSLTASLPCDPPPPPPPSPHPSVADGLASNPSIFR